MSSSDIKIQDPLFEGDFAYVGRHTSNPELVRVDVRQTPSYSTETEMAVVLLNVEELRAALDKLFPVKDAPVEAEPPQPEGATWVIGADDLRHLADVADSLSILDALSSELGVAEDDIAIDLGDEGFQVNLAADEDGEWGLEIRA